MDFIYILIVLWLLVETAMFLLQKNYEEETSDTQQSQDSDLDGAGSYNSSELSNLDYEDDSGVVGGSSRPANKIDKKRRQLLLAKRLARRNHDRQTVLAYFRNKKSDRKSESDEGEDGYDSDYETTQAELIELFVKMAEYIRWHKIVTLYNLSKKFQLTTQKMHEYLKKLQTMGLLDGVCDDRGKFIYVAKPESKAVFKFIEEQNLNNFPQIGLI